ncbi:MAG: MerR family transcriptional regulator [Leucobacter sp.]|nr:MerR family transcriptional regulator [Leucobacter sp.]
MTSTAVNALAQSELHAAKRSPPVSSPPVRSPRVPSAPVPSPPVRSPRLPSAPVPSAPVPSSAESSPADPSTATQEGRPVGITEAAAIVGLTAHTLRYYEQQGLVSPARNSAGYREYSSGALRRLVFLARMRVSGMPMRELRRYIGLVEVGDATIPDRRAMMRAQRDRIRLQLRELELSLEATDFKIRTYDGHPEP